MNNFSNLESLYKYLEENAMNYENPQQIGNLFLKLRDLKLKENKTKEAKKVQWEVDFFSFILEEGKAEPMFIGTNKRGEIIEYPTFNRFIEETYEYLINRLSSTSNPMLKARYSHILWCSPKKHTKYAKIAVDSYLELVKIYEEKDIKEPQKHYGLYVLNAIKNAYFIGAQVNYKIEELKEETKRLISTFNFESSSSFVLRFNLIKLMLDDKKRFKQYDFVGLEKICCKITESLKKSGNMYGAIRMLELGKRVSQKLGKKTNSWEKKIAESYEILMNKAELVENKIAALTFCLEALEYYKQLKDESKINQLEKKYLELKNTIKFAELATTINLTEHIKSCKQIAEKVTQKEPEEIIKFLMCNKEILPKYEDIAKVVKNYSEEFVLQNLISKEIIDQNGHPAQLFSNDEEREYFYILQLYDLQLKIEKIYLINEILFSAIKKSKLSTKILLEFFSKYSWFGKTITNKVANQTIEYNWLSLIAPALNEYFLQMQYFFVNPDCLPNLVLSIDSLTLKFEGLIRDICQFFGEPTYYKVKGKNIVREKDIHALLHEDVIKELFDKDDLLFFKFLLVEKAGYNLRHKVAHSLMLFPEYSIFYMHLLIIALLRIGKYDFVKKEDTNLCDNE
ncbi:DUF4209 domain-containing protein [Thermosipho atlanticus]|uniref:DUF4209 domain-containing protein n=1 Tax=Thermosipho atlanticus DSM 15807 TaxID=1123380 RepID=A0A1M5RNB3_9BACT|nr:DUF4209 domain-containing protein [Thermosipho atlanticus]SHH27568.1 protein of unknown function [Thermosipho atlanticus DSM 15807]